MTTDMSLEPSFRPEQREAKYTIQDDRVHEIWSTVASQLAPREGRGVRWVRTTYFDTPDRVFCRSINSPVSRRLRVREYVPVRATLPCEDPGGRHCYLELKQSRDGQRSKLRLKKSIGEIYETLAGLAPAGVDAIVATQYRRAALTDDDESIRITLDDEISFCRVAPIGSPLVRPDDTCILGAEPRFVLEIKMRGEDPRWLRDLRGLLPPELPYSKFECALAAASGGGVMRAPLPGRSGEAAL